MSYVAKGCAAFAIGLFITALCGYSFFYIPVVVFGVFGLLFLVFSRYISIKRLWLYFLIAMVGSCCFGIHAIFVYKPAIEYAETSQEIQGILKEKVEYENNNKCYIIAASKIGEQNFLMPFNIKLYANEHIDVDYGDEIIANALLLRSTDENEFYILNSNLSKANYLQCKLTDDVKVVKRFSLTGKFLDFRDFLMNSVKRSIKSPQSSIINAVLFGKSGDIPYELSRAASRCGLLHMFAVSGLHISILSAALMYLLKFLRCNNKISSIIVGGVLLCFVAMAGFTPSAMRACIMALISTMSLLLKKRFSGLGAIFVAAAVILLISPPAALGLSFILSFASCFGILLFAEPIFNWIRDKFSLYRPYQTAALEIFSVSLAAVLASFPVLLVAFRKLSILSPFVNILIMPFIPILFISGLLTAVIGIFSLDVANVIGYFCEGLCGVIFSCVEFISKIPFCCLPANYGFVPLVLICCAIFIAIAFFYNKNFARVKLTALFCAIIIIVPTISNIVMTKNACTLTVIGNGYGSSVVINADGKTIVINCGGGYNSGKNVCEFLDSRGIQKIDALIFTETNNQHMQGADNLIKAMPISCTVIPQEARYTNIHQLATKQGSKIVWAKDAKVEFYPITIDISTKTKSTAFLLVVGGLCFGFSNNVSSLMAAGNKQYINVALIDNNFSGWYGDFETGYNIILKNQDDVPKDSYVAASDKSVEFVINGGMLKAGWL